MMQNTITNYETSSVATGGGANIHIFLFTDLKNNGFQKKLMMQNTITQNPL